MKTSIKSSVHFCWEDHSRYIIINFYNTSRAPPSSRSLVFDGSTVQTVQLGGIGQERNKTNAGRTPLLIALGGLGPSAELETKHALFLAYTIWNTQISQTNENKPVNNDMKNDEWRFYSAASSGEQLWSLPQHYVTHWTITTIREMVKRLMATQRRSPFLTLNEILEI